MAIKLFVNGEEMDLFSDETITITSQLKDIRDISQIFASFSQQFSVPASGRNNKILERFFDNTLNVPTSVKNFRLKQPSAIDIDGIIYKRGNIKYDKAIFKMGKISHHQITFTGIEAGLTEVLRDYNLSDITGFDIYNHQSNEWVTRNGMDNTSSLLFDNDIIYPLINSSASGWTATNLSDATNPFDTLKPAIRMDSIIDVINTFYTPGLDKDGLKISIHDDFVSENIYMYLSNVPDEDDNRTNLTFSGSNAVELSSNPTIQADPDIWRNIVNTETGVWDIGQIINQSYFDMRWDIILKEPSGHTWTTGTTWSLIIDRKDYGSDEWIPTGIQQNGNTAAVFRMEGDQSQLGFELIRFRLLASTGSEPFEIKMDYSIRFNFSFLYVFRVQTDLFFSQRPVAEIVALRMPTIKVVDWLKGIINMFNFIPVFKVGGESEGFKNRVILTPYNTWLADGQQTFDITKLVDETQFSIDIPNIPKSIEFKYLEAKAENGVEFRQSIGRGFGDLIQKTAGGDGEKFEIQLPFENLLWEKLSGTDYLVGEMYTRDSGTFSSLYGAYVDLKPVTDVPFFMYYDTDGATEDIEFKDWLGPISEYKLCNTVASQSSGATSLNFNFDLDPFALSARTDVITLYNEYSIMMDKYINPTSRIYNFEGVIPISILSQIELNDILKIKDKHYFINKIQVDTLTTNTKLELINLYRQANPGVAPISDNTDPQICAIWIDESDGPTQPTNLTGTSITATGFELCWSASTSEGQIVTQYDIYKDEVLYDSISGSPADTCVTITGQTSGSTALWTVVAEDDATERSIASSALEVTTLGPSSLTFVNPLTLVSTGSTSISISWLSALPGDAAITGYTSYLDGVPIFDMNSAARSTTYGGLTANTCYDLTVEVIDFTGGTDTSAILNVCTGIQGPSTPAPLWATDIVTSGFTLHWNPSIPVSGCTINEYEIYKDGVHGWSVTGGPPPNEAGLVGFDPGESGLFKVLAIDTCGGRSDLSAGLNVTMASEGESEISQLYNISDGPGSIRSQGFQIGDVVVDDTFYVIVYSHQILYVVQSGDDADDVAQGLVDGVNGTSEAQWDDFNSAPPSGTVGFKPVGTNLGSGAFNLDLNYQNQFAFGVFPA